MKLKLKKDTMLGILGFFVAVYVSIFIAKFFGLLGFQDNNFIKAFLGCAIGIICRLIFKFSLAKVKEMESNALKRKSEEQVKEAMRNLDKNLDFVKDIDLKRHQTKELEIILRKLKEGNKDLNAADLEEIHTKAPNITSLVSEKATELVFYEIRSDKKEIQSIDNAQNDYKSKTVVNLFLLKEKKKLLTAKFISMAIILIAALGFIFVNLSFKAFIPGCLLLAILHLKDQVLTYRVEKGYFGTNATEALQLIKFIHANIDQINKDGGGHPKILNDEVPQELKPVKLPGQVQHG